MTTLATSIEILFFLVAAVVFLVNFTLEKGWKSAEPNKILPPIKNAFFIAIPFLVLFGVAAALKFESIGKLPYFLGTLFIPFILRKLVVTPWLRGVLLLILTASVTLIPGQTGDNAIGMIAGLVVWKCCENLLGANPCDLDDFLPSFVWLTTVYWSFHESGGAGSLAHVGLVAGALSVAMLLRWIQLPLLHEDRVYLKRLVLSITGGLAVLIVVMKLLVGASFDNYAIVCGAGFLGAYVIESFDGKRGEKTGIMKSVAQLVLIAIFTIALTRILGTFATLAVAATMFVAPRSLMPKVAAIYFCTRALVQAYVDSYNPNVTGINLEHAYSTAAMYAGFLIVLALFVGIRELGRRSTTIAALLAGSVLMPIACAYLLHAEPTASLLLSTLVAGAIVAVCGAALSKQEVTGFENIIFVPAIMCCTALISADVLSSGEGATMQNRLTGIGVAAVVVVCVWIVRKVMGSKQQTCLVTKSSE